MPGKTLEDVKLAAAEMDERPAEPPPIDERASFTTAVTTAAPSRSST